MHIRLPRVLTVLAGALWLSASTTAVHAAVITFDDMPAPSSLADAPALVTQYTGLGVTFSGTGAVLDETSDFMVTGYSASNFLAYFSEAIIDFAGAGVTSKAFDEVTFTGPLTAVSFNAGSGLFPAAGRLLTAQAFDAGGQLVAMQSITLGSALQAISLTGPGIVRVTFGVATAFDDEDGVGFVIDDLSTTGAGDPVPEPSLMALMASALSGVVLLRRRTTR